MTQGDGNNFRRSPRSGGPRRVDVPDSPFSVGYTEPRHVELATAGEPFAPEAGGKVGPVVVEYETYGELASKKDNVVLVCHGFSGDVHAAGWDRTVPQGRTWRSKGPGWWDAMIGPGKPIDTNRFFVICSNFLGGCYGTTGPASINPATGRAYGLDFPLVTVGDWVRLQGKMLRCAGDPAGLHGGGGVDGGAAAWMAAAVSGTGGAVRGAGGGGAAVGRGWRSTRWGGRRS